MKEKEFPRPTVLVSRCLEFDNVRYDGKVIPSKIVKDLEPYVDYIKVCPEVEIGLGIPRDPIRIVKTDGEYKLMQPKTNRDVTKEMDEFTDKFISDLPEVDGFIFKSGSPTIGIRNIKVYSGIKDAPVIEKGSGFFANKVLEKHPGYPIEEDDRLRNDKIRHDFLTYLFTFTQFRRLVKDMSFPDLKEFHSQNRFLFSSYNEEIFNELDSIIDGYNNEGSLHPLYSGYEELLKKLFTYHPSSQSYISVATKLFSSFSETVPDNEKEHFFHILKKYENNLIGIQGLLEVLQLYTMRYDTNNIIDDKLFTPYPPELQAVIDEKRDKDYWK